MYVIYKDPKIKNCFHTEASAKIINSDIPDLDVENSLIRIILEAYTRNSNNFEFMTDYIGKRADGLATSFSKSQDSWLCMAFRRKMGGFMGEPPKTNLLL